MIQFKRSVFMTAAIAASIYLTGCTESIVTNSETSKQVSSESISIKMALPVNVDTKTEKASVAVYSEGVLLKEVILNHERGGISGTLSDLPANKPLVFKMSLTDSNGNLIYSGEASAELTAGKTVPVVIKLKAATGSAEIIGLIDDETAPAKGLVHYLSFDNGMVDDMGNTVVTHYGTPSFGQGIAGTALRLDGKSAVMLDDFYLPNRQNVTISFWIKPEKGTEYFSDIISKHSCGSDVEFLCRTEGGMYDVEWTIGGNWIDVSNNAYTDDADILLKRADGNDAVGLAVPTYTDYDFFAATYNGKEVNVYINGKLVGRKYASGDIAKNMSNTFTIGKRADMSSEFLTGSIDELKVYDFALSAVEVAAEYSTVK